MARPDLAENDRFDTHSARGANQAELDEIVADWTRTKDQRELIDLMEEHGIPAGGIYRAPEMLEDAHFQARQAIIETMHPEFGKLRMQNVAPKLSATPGSVRSAGPALGEHTEEILTGLLGFDSQRMTALREAGAI